MKKIFVTLLFLLLFVPVALAVDYLPSSTNTIPSGIGVCAATETSFLYAKPDSESALKEIIKIKDNDIKTLRETLSPQSSFIVFLPSKNIFYYVAKNENEKWCNVIYNKPAGKTGWIEKKSDADFMTWKEFFYRYGKENGVYFLSDVPAKLKRLHTSPDEGAQVVKDAVYPSNISMLSISGNWMLVKIIDFDGENRIGWTRWRGDDGELYVFPLFQ